MIKAIQEGYYLNAKNPSDFDTLIAFAEEIGLDVERFEIALNSESTIEKLNEEMHMARSIGAQGFPSLILKSNKFAEAEETKSQALKKPQWQNVPYDYNDASVTLRQTVPSLHCSRRKSPTDFGYSTRVVTISETGTPESVSWSHTFIS